MTTRRISRQPTLPFSYIKDDIIAQTTPADVLLAWDRHARSIAVLPSKARDHLAAYRVQKIAGIRRLEAAAQGRRAA